MIHAVSINSRYLSFVTMNSCQEFYDEMATIFNIPKIELISNYDPNNLSSNVEHFNNCMDKWLELYKTQGVEVNYYANLTELEKLYNTETKNK